MPLVKISDYIVERLASADIADAFMVTGGGSMHLNDSLGKHPRMNCTFFHHEQSCAIAADSYYRLTNRLPVINVTTGPGGTNAITGVYGAWVDSIGMIVLSGQVKWETMVRSTDLPLRQLGDQAPIRDQPAIDLVAAILREDHEEVTSGAVNEVQADIGREVPVQ